MINQYWAHISSGEVFAVQVEGERVHSACGPLYYKERTAANLDDWNFENEPETAIWLNRNQDDFKLMEENYYHVPEEEGK